MSLTSTLKNSLKIAGQLLTLLCTLLCAGVALAGAQITGVRVWTAPDSTRLVLDLSGPVEHNLFTLQNPARVVVDLTNTQKSPSLDTLDTRNAGPIANVRSAPQAGNSLRVVLDLKKDIQPKSFLLKPNEQYGHRLVIDLYDQAPGAPTASATPVASAAPQAKPYVAESAPLPTPRPASNVGGRDIIVAIDPGHGGEDPGAIGPTGAKEKDLVLQISRRLQQTLNAEKGVKAVLVRNGDYFLPLASRREIARKKHRADLFVSIHADAFSRRSAHGASVFALSRSGATSTLARVLAEKENQSDLIGGVSLDDKDDTLASVLADLAMEGSMEHSMKVGDSVLRNMGRVTPLHKKRMEQAGFAVLKSADIPSILVETGFISNPTEERNLRSEAHQTKLARAIGQGIIHYFDQHPPPDTYFARRKETGGTLLASGDNRQHRIERGETLSHIAARYQVSLASLMRYNALNDPQLVKVGQVLRIPNS
jgi:N-acetylmuramoyl-L-alanine amidase